MTFETRDAEKNVAHVHHTRIAKHPIEPLLRDRDQPDVDDVTAQQDEEEPAPMPRAFREKRQRDAKQSVKPELLQHARMQHRRRRWRRGIRFRRPGVKRKERNENAESDQEEEENRVLRARWNGTTRGDRLQRAQIKTSRSDRHAAIEQDQTEEQNKAAEREINRHFPGGGVAVAAAPDSDKQKRRDQRQLVKHVEEKHIERRESANRAARDEEQAA